MNLILCGMPKAGKTTVGKKIAEIEGCPFIDTDALIGPCREITLKHGEPYFRALEKEKIQVLQDVTGSVISLGGGTLLNPDNFAFLSKLGVAIYLKTPVDLIWERIDAEATYLDPTNPRQSLIALAKAREPIYEAFAQITIDTSGQSIDDTIKKIWDLIPSVQFLGSQPGANLTARQ